VNESQPASFDAPPDSIDLSPDVHIDFHEGAARGVYWATLHVGPDAIEIGSARTSGDVSNVLTMAAGVLLERPLWVTDTHIGPNGRFVLIGCWVLSALLSDPHHVEWNDEASARWSFGMMATEP